MLSRVIATRTAAAALTRTLALATEQKQPLHTSASTMAMKGQVYRKEPVKMSMEKGKTYNWCACGLSKKQPLCDGSHKRSSGGLLPIPFTPDATKEYILCNCKQTNRGPLCDGSHKK